MSLTALEQAAEQIKQGQNAILIISHKAKIDSMVAMFALQKYLEKMGKKTIIVVDEELVIPKKLGFLEQPIVQYELPKLHQFIISLNTSNIKASEFQYHMKENALEILIRPEKGMFAPTDVSFPTVNNSDMLITVGVSDLEHVGKIYEENTEFFYETPILNIDHSPENENFGQVNLIDINATSTSEVLYHLFEKINPEYIDSDIATYLLTGIIAQTRSFRSAKVTPATLEIAAELIKREARREEIVKNLYRTRTLSTLKLWGRVLARLEHDQEYQLVWSLLNHHDFLKTNTSEEHLFDIIDELIVNIPQVEIIALFYEKENQNICGIINTTNKNLNCHELISSLKLNGGKNIALFETSQKELTTVEHDIVEEIRNSLRRIKNHE